MQLRFLLLLLVTLGLLACSTSKQPYKPVREKTTQEQARQLKKVHDLWKAEDPKFPEARNEVLKEPVTAAWWSRTLVAYAVGSYQQHLRAQQDLIGTLKTTEPVGYKKALQELRIAGSVAVPVVVNELLRHYQAKNRALGVQILIYMGPGIVPDLEPYLTHKEMRVRRQVLEVLGGLASDARAKSLLVQYSNHADWSIRAQALESLAQAGESQLPRLHQAVVGDPDSFVRRRVVMALGRFKDKQSATVVLAYYKEVLRAGDRSGIRAAQQTLQAMSGIRGNQTEAFWERWVQSLPTKT